MIELAAADHQVERFRGFVVHRRSVGRFEVDFRDPLGGDFSELAFEIGKAPDYARADAAAAGFLARECRLVEHQRGAACVAQSSGRGCAGRARAHDDYVEVHCLDCIGRGQLGRNPRNIGKIVWMNDSPVLVAAASRLSSIGITTRTSAVSVRLYRNASQAVNAAARYSLATTRPCDWYQ